MIVLMEMMILIQRYREVMDERIENARAPAAKKALSILYDFVSSKE